MGRIFSIFKAFINLSIFCIYFNRVPWLSPCKYLCYFTYSILIKVLDFNLCKRCNLFRNENFRPNYNNYFLYFSDRSKKRKIFVPTICLSYFLFSFQFVSFLKILSPAQNKCSKLSWLMISNLLSRAIP